MEDDRILLNGIDGSTGDYLYPSLSDDDVVNIARNLPVDPKHGREMEILLQKRTQAGFGVKRGVDYDKLSSAGWGVIFQDPGDDESLKRQIAEIKEALEPLLAHRTRLAGDRYRCYEGPDGYRREDTHTKFLARKGVAGGNPVDPARVPYYLLIVGDPAQISYEFQYQLDVVYGVGRIHFETPSEYHQYANAVVDAETGSTWRSREAAFFGVASDPTTEMSRDYLIAPLAKYSAENSNLAVKEWMTDDATRSRLTSIFRGDESRPALLFTASHGMGFSKDLELQRRHGGALMCQKLESGAPLVKRDCYFAGEDLPSDANVSGMIVFAFACFGAGTPDFDSFSLGTKEPRRLATSPFIAELPRKLLTHPRGGALAVIGHVDLAWSGSFFRQSRSQLETFESVLLTLFEGSPIGAATEYINGQYASLATQLAPRLIKNPDLENKTIANMWTSCADARNYAVVGDPAVRLVRNHEPVPMEDRPVPVQIVTTPPAAKREKIEISTFAPDDPSRLVAHTTFEFDGSPESLAIWETHRAAVERVIKER